MGTSVEPKGLRFEVFVANSPYLHWKWALVGKDGAVCVSANWFSTEAEARSDISTQRNRLKAAKFAKVFTV